LNVTVESTTSSLALIAESVDSHAMPVSPPHFTSSTACKPEPDPVSLSSPPLALPSAPPEPPVPPEPTITLNTELTPLEVILVLLVVVLLVVSPFETVVVVLSGSSLITAVDELLTVSD